MITAITIIMDSPSLYRLMAWLSPSYPVGAFSYSHGIEWLVETGAIRDRETLAAWLSDLLRLSSGRNDAILFVQAYNAARAQNFDALCNVADLASAIAGTAERGLESNSQGDAFAEVTRRTWSSGTLDKFAAISGLPVSYPVAVGITVADHNVPLAPALRAYMHALTANLVSAGVRLIPLGHSDGQRVMQALEHAVEEAAQQGEAGNLSSLCSITIMADLASMKHETQYTRLFRS